MELDNTRVQFLLRFYPRLEERAFMLDLCSALGRHPVQDAVLLRNNHWNFSSHDEYKIGDIVVIQAQTQKVVAYVVKNDETYNDQPLISCDFLCNFVDAQNRPLFDAIDTFTLEKGVMHNSERIKTTFGRFLFNYLIWYRHEGVDFEYINEQQKSDVLGSTIARLLLEKKITPDVGRKIINSVFYLASFDALFVPTLTERSLMNSPEVMKRKKELIEEYGERLKDPIVAKEYEQELIALDKKFLEGDKSLRFLNALSAKKTYGIHRKKLFIGIGGIPAFDPGSNAYTFIPNSLSEGWTAEALPDICNEIRKGAYDRGKETAKGGEQTKFLLRVFQDVRITEDDCGSHLGLPVELTEDNVKDYLGQYIVTPKGPVLLDSSNASKFMNQKILLRSPMFCKTKIGRCKICSGNMFDQLDMKAIGMTVLKVGSRFTTLSMKNMHGTVITTKKIEPFDYVVQN